MNFVFPIHRIVIIRVRSGTSMDIRGEWLTQLARECQLLAGACLPDREVSIDAPLERFLERLPTPDSAIERAFLRGMLVETCVRFGEAVHRAFHSRHVDGDTRCAFAPTAFTSPLTVAVNEPHEIVMAWLGPYRHAFIREHPRYLADATRRVLDEEFAAADPLRPLAKRYGTSIARLKSTFAGAFGVSTREYIVRKRVAIAITMLQTTDEKVETIARAVGWTSRKDLNKRISDVVGLTPTEVRRRDPAPR
jgi:AraC-like DNA-binding protein